MRQFAFALAFVLAACPAQAYRLLLDIDLDDDPSTFNTCSSEDTVLVSLVLAPEFSGEWIDLIEFGLGGSCWDSFDCGHRYGTGTELYSGFGDWLEHPLFESSGSGGALCINCCGSPGFHFMYYAEASGIGFPLEGNIFLDSFLAWALADDDPHCPLPQSDLMTFSLSFADPWCEILLAQEVSSIPIDLSVLSTWREVKRLY